MRPSTAPSSWEVLVPVKDVRLAKSRLRAVGEPARRDLALAMAADVVSAALVAEGVARVSVVSDDDEVAALAAALGAHPLRVRTPGLNAALEEAAARVDGPVAALCADLPCLRPEDLAGALAGVPAGGRGVVPDLDGTGTTLLAAAAGPLAPQYGPGSLARHTASGALVLAAPAGLRLDVDTETDLARARALGLGAATARALSLLRSA